MRLRHFKPWEVLHCILLDAALIRTEDARLGSTSRSMRGTKIETQDESIEELSCVLAPSSTNRIWLRFGTDGGVLLPRSARLSH